MTPGALRPAALLLLILSAGVDCGRGAGAPERAAEPPPRWEYADLTSMTTSSAGGGAPTTSLIWTAPDTTFQVDSYREFAAHFPDVHPPAQLDGVALGLNVAGARGWELTTCYAVALPAAGIVTECYLKRAAAVERTPRP